MKKFVDNAVAFKFRSAANNEPIMAIFTGLKRYSQNRKLGRMVTVYVVTDSETSPQDAVHNGSDEAICGQCPMRPSLAGGCYVVKWMGPNAVGKSYKAGNIPVLTDVNELIDILIDRDLPIRWGEYGDAAMLPFEFVDAVMKGVKGLKHTSYTHQWNEDYFDPRHLRYSMASIDHRNTVEMLRRRHTGDDVRYYRIIDDKAAITDGEIYCPSKDAAGKIKVKCADCGLCNGANSKTKNITIVKGK